MSDSYSSHPHRRHSHARSRHSHGSVVSCASSSSSVPCTPPANACDDPKPTGIMQTMDNLTVTNLFTGKHLGSTLVLTGNGNRCRAGLSDTALCVRSGARIVGHTVANTIQMSGDLSTTEGVTCNRADVGAPEGFTVSGIPAGPHATAQLLSRLSSVIVTKGPIGAKEMMLGTPVSSTGVPASFGFIVVPLAFEGTGTTFATADTNVSVEVDEIQHAMKVVCISVSAKIALLAFAEATPATCVFIPMELDARKQLPLPGSPVVFMGADTTQGTYTAHHGVVSQTCTNMFYEYTSMIVSLEGTINAGSIGGAILSPEGTLLAILQHGTTASAPSGINPVYQRAAGGIRVPFIKFVIDTYLQTPTSPVELHCLTRSSAQVKARQIGAGERSSLFTKGGILDINAGSGTPRQLLNLSVQLTGNPIPVLFPLGTNQQIPNVPSLPDSLLDAYLTYGTSISSVDLVYANNITASYPPASSDFTVALPDLGASALWSAGSPFQTGFSMTSSKTQTDFLLANVTGPAAPGAVVPRALSFFSTSFNCAFSTSNFTGCFQLSNSSTVPNDILVYIFWGIFALNPDDHYTGLGAVSHGVIPQRIQDLAAPAPAGINRPDLSSALDAAWTVAQSDWVTLPPSGGAPATGGDYVITVLCPSMPSLSILQVVPSSASTFTVSATVTGSIASPTLDVAISGAGVLSQAAAGIPCSKPYNNLSFLVGPTTPPTMDLVIGGTFTFISNVPNPSGGGGNVTPCTVSSRVY